MPIDPIAQKMLDDARASGRPNAHLLPIAVARENFEKAFAGLAKPAVARVVDLTKPTRDGDRIRGRVYLPDLAGELPLTVYYHGGGWLMGSIDSHDVTTRLLSNAAGSAVLSVDYRRGPEHRFPVAVDDAIDALLWALDTRTVADLGVDTRRLAVAGDSAGGNLACAVAIYARDADLSPAVCHQLLVYPASTTDLTIGFDHRYQGVMLERDECLWHQSNYLTTQADHADPRMTLLNADLTGLPDTTVILAECDPIKPQGVLLADALSAAGVPTTTQEYAGMIHGFFGLDEIFPLATEAMQLAAERLAHALRPSIGTPR
jgi:acetyl esterase